MSMRTDEELDRIMKGCQVGDGRAPEKVNQLLADCYGAIGSLRYRVETLEAELADARSKCAENEEF
jgi:hypothetical protein